MNDKTLIVLVMTLVLIAALGVQVSALETQSEPLSTQPLAQPVSGQQTIPKPMATITPSLYLPIIRRELPPEPITDPTVEVVATGLSVPWALAFASDGRIFFTERPGRIRVIEGGVLQPDPVAEPPVQPIGEGGLMGLALAPDFASSDHIFLMYTYSADSELFNKIARYTLTDAGLTDEFVLLDDIPGASTHDGGRIAFGPDGKLYATTGDAQQPNLAQDPDSLAGKILRLNPDGSVPADNPTPGSYVYSLGHRNPQGLAWHPETGLFYSTEHGPSGEFGLCCRDEANQIVPGGNYGWPLMAGTTVITPSSEDLIEPFHSSGLDTWAPASAAFYDGDELRAWQGNFFFGGLRGRHIQRVVLGGPDHTQVQAVERLFEDEYGRIRDVVVGPDGYIYFTTSNTDGRGTPVATDDRILRIMP
jgi:glucose/arabinose dehydrogenase